MADAKKKKTCLMIGLGCGGITVLAGVVAAFLIFQQTQKFKADFENPLPRAKKVLGTETLPEGYYANMAMSIPFIWEMAIISSAPNEDTERPEFGETGFMFFKFLFGGKGNRELKDYFEGHSDDPSVLRDNNINIDTDEIIQRDVFDLEGQKFYYLIQRGSVRLDSGRTEGLATLMLISCEKDTKFRMGIWFQPDPDPSLPVEELELAGTVGDVARLKTFLTNFRFCK